MTRVAGHRGGRGITTELRPGSGFRRPQLCEVPFQADSGCWLSDALQHLDGPEGFVLVTGIPVAGLSAEEACDVVVELLAGVGDAMPQGPWGASTLAWLVRDEGVSRFRDDGEYQENVYTSKSTDRTDIHNDAAMLQYAYEVDAFGLLCLHAAELGGDTVVVNTAAVIEVLHAEYPDELASRAIRLRTVPRRPSGAAARALVAGVRVGRDAQTGPLQPPADRDGLSRHGNGAGPARRGRP